MHALVRRAVVLGAVGAAFLGLATPSLAAPPANDNFAAAQALTGSAGIVTGTTVDATIEPLEPALEPSTGNTVWYRWAAAADGPVVFDISASQPTFDSGFYALGTANAAVLTGADLASLVRIARFGNTYRTGESAVQSAVVNATAGTTYYIRVYGDDLGPNRDVVLQWGAPPPNNAFGSASAISGSAGSTPGTSVGATREADEPSGQASTWYRWTSDTTGTVTFTLAGQYGHTAAAYEERPLASLTQIAGGFRGNRPIIRNGHATLDTVDWPLSFAARAGTTYMIRVVPNSSHGTYTLSWSTGAPPNDNMLAAYPGLELGLYPGKPIRSSNLGATPGVGGLSEPAGATSIWFAEYVGEPRDAVVTLETTGSEIATTISVYKNTGVSLVPVTSDDGSAGNGASRVTFRLDAEAFWVMVNGKNGAQGEIRLTGYLVPPPNDNLAQAQPIQGASGAVSGSTDYATLETGDPVTMGGTIWYRWTAPQTGLVALDRTGSHCFDEFTCNPYRNLPLVNVFRGTERASLVEIAPQTPQGSLFPVVAGETYAIVVGGDYSQGNWAVLLQWGYRPANDDVAGAVPLAGLSGQVGGTTVGATFQAGEPERPYLSGPGTVWYRLVPTTNGSLRITPTPLPGNFPALVQFLRLGVTVYEGSAFGALTRRGEGNSVTVDVVAGRTYLVQAYPYILGGSSLLPNGPFTLAWTISPTATPPPTVSVGDATATGDSQGSVVSFPVTLSRADDEPTTVSYTLAPGTALAGQDYVGTPGSVTIPAFSTTGTIAVPVLPDTIDEDDETLTVTLASPVNATIDDGQATGTITDDDPPPRLSVGDATVIEGNSGMRSVAVVISLQGGTQLTVTGSWATAPGTATGGGTTGNGDFVSQTGTFAIPPGQASVPITLQVVGDTAIEPTESFSVTLSSVVRATVIDADARVSIVNDDDVTPPVIAAKPDVIVETRASSVFVPYSRPTATDAVDGNVIVACTPDGSAFANGTSTLISCTARDRSLNVATSSFRVIVRPPTTTGAVSRPKDTTQILTDVRRHQRVRVTAGGFAPKSHVEIVWIDPGGESDRLEKTRADRDGRIDITLRIPKHAPRGAAQMTAVGTTPGGNQHVRGWTLTVTK